MDAARAEILALMQEKEARPVHVRHVARLALQMFDQLASLHGYGPRERLLLEAASYLHDIGHGVSGPHAGPGHHKESARLIRENAWQHLRPLEIELIAQIARYHRKALPETAHEEFRALGALERRLVVTLAAILRLADSFDRTHTQTIRQVTVEVTGNRLRFHLDASGSGLKEVRAARHKGDLAERAFQRDLSFLVNGEEVEFAPEE